MGEEFLVAPAPRTPYIELARVKQGKLFRKQILKMGQTFVHPADKKTKITVTPEMASKMIENFRAGYCDTVQFPVCDENNKHSESVLDNLGEVIDVQSDDTGVYAIIDARKHADDVNSTILGASAFFSLDYEDTETGDRVGPTLLHVAATNRPYLTNLGPYEEIAASNAMNGDVIMLSEEQPEDPPEAPESAPAEEPAPEAAASVEPPAATAETSDDSADTSVETDATAAEDQMDLDQLLAELKDKHGVDVPALQQTAQELEAAREQLATVGLSAAQNSDTEITSVDLAEALVELSNTVREQGAVVTTLRTENEGLRRDRAVSEVDGLIEDGRILPKSREVMIELAMTDRDRFTALVPDAPLVALSEIGAQVHEEPEKAKAHDETVDRYVSLSAAVLGAKRPVGKRRHVVTG